VIPSFAKDEAKGTGGPNLRTPSNGSIAGDRHGDRPCPRRER
jgi:hypothetical protein